jgi:hypothetical protein
VEGGRFCNFDIYLIGSLQFLLFSCLSASGYATAEMPIQIALRFLLILSKVYFSAIVPLPVRGNFC